MNKILRLLLIIVLPLNLVNCKKNKVLEDPNNIGNEIFGIIKDFNIKPMEEYISATISVNEIKEIAKDTLLMNDNYYRRKSKMLTDERWAEEKIKQYKNLKQVGIDKEINWSKIEYLDFTYEKNEEQGSEICNGKTYFQYNDNVFYAKSKSIFNGNGYRLVLIEEIKNKY